MTHLEFHKLSFLMELHISFDTEHFASYRAKTPKGDVVIQTCTRRLKNGEFRKVKRTYIFRNKEYKTIDELLKDYNEAE